MLKDSWGKEEVNRRYIKPQEKSGWSIGAFVVLFLLSCLLRYILEICANTVMSHIRVQANWKQYWEESGCSGEEGGSSSFLCKAVGLCIQEVVPEIVPSSPDDIIIQLLLIGLMVLAADLINLEVRVKKE